MTLKDYLAAEDETTEAFAARVLASTGMIHKIVYGTRQPSLPLAAKITEATGGAVQTVDMLLPIRSAPRTRKPADATSIAA